MSVLTLQYPVYTMEHKLLLAAGTPLTREAMEPLFHAKGKTTYRSYPFLRFGTIRKDLLSFINTPPFNVIFAGENSATEILTIADEVRLSLPFLHLFDYFKNNDPYTYSHILTVFALSTLLSKELIFDYKEQVRNIAAFPTHDIGKACVPLEVLKKTSPLTQQEKEVLRHHVPAGYLLCSYYLQDPHSLAAVVARDHHERRDGSGYPQGLKLTNLMVETVAVSDMYNALISARPYRRASYDNRTALEEITGMAEKGKFSWETVNALVALNRKAKPDHRKGNIVSMEKRGTPPDRSPCNIISDDSENDRR